MWKKIPDASSEHKQIASGDSEDINNKGKGDKTFTVKQRRKYY